MTREQAMALSLGDRVHETIPFRQHPPAQGEVIRNNANGFTVRWDAGMIEFIRYDSGLLQFIEKKEG